MREIMVLTRMQLGAALEFLIISKKRKSNKKQMSVYAIFLIAFALFSFLSTMYSYSLGTVLKMTGGLEILPGLFMAVTSFFIFFTTVYKVKGTLFGFKDYDIVMSLPVSTSKVVASRVLLLYIMNIVLTIAILIPSYIVYGILASPGVYFYVSSILSVFFVPLLPIIIASVIGTILAFISSRFKHTNLLNTILLFGFVIAMMGSSIFIQSDEQLAEVGSMLTNQMKKIYLPSVLFLEGIQEGEFISFVLFILLSLGSFFLYTIIVGKVFKKLNSGIMAKTSTANYKLKNQTQNSIYLALVKKELKRFFSSSLYVMNTCFGLVMTLIGAIVILFFKPAQLQAIFEVPELLDQIKGLLPLALSFMASSVGITASSISLEGKNLWILKSSPIQARTIFAAKIGMSMLVSVPILVVSGILLGIVFQLDAIFMVLAIVYPVVTSYFIAVLGIVVNLKLPLLDWTSEVVVIKQSASSMITIFGSMILEAIPFVLVFVLKVDVLLVNIGFLFILALLSFGLQQYLNKEGNHMLARL